MEKNKHTKLWVVLIVIIAIAACLLGYEVFFHNASKAADPAAVSTPKATISSVGNQTKPSASTSLDQTAVSVSGYTVYQLDDIDFRFIIAKVHVKSDSALNLSLDHFKTSEGITLDQVSDYVTQLESHFYYLGRQNVWFSIISQNSETDTNLFIPVKDSTLTSLTVSTDFGNNADMTFNLNDPKGSSSDLLYQADDVITDGKSYEMTVSEAFDITGSYLYQTVDNEQQEFLLPSTTKVYAFHVQAVSLWGDSVTLESAQYVPEGSSETFDALDASIRSEKFDNILGKTISDKDSGYLFFYAFDPDDNPITYHGVLKLKLQGSDSVITVNVNLN